MNSFTGIHRKFSWYGHSFPLYPRCDVTAACMKKWIWKWVMASYCAVRCCTRMRWFRWTPSKPRHSRFDKSYVLFLNFMFHPCPLRHVFVSETDAICYGLRILNCSICKLTHSDFHTLWCLQTYAKRACVKGSTPVALDLVVFSFNLYDMCVLVSCCVPIPNVYTIPGI